MKTTMVIGFRVEKEAKGELEYMNPNALSLKPLWSYKCELTRGRSVMYMSWNKVNEDILAIAYGESRTYANQSPGLILCWSIKNPEWPERIYETESQVTALDFSKMTPNLLATGFQDGRVIIYDVKRKTNAVALDHSENNGNHRDPVWELKWVEKEGVLGEEQSKSEILVSISTDGRVTQWMIRKGLEFTVLTGLHVCGTKTKKTRFSSSRVAETTLLTLPGHRICRLALRQCVQTEDWRFGTCRFQSIEIDTSLDPAITQNVLDRHLTTVSFATKSPIVVTGDDMGAVSVFKLCRGSVHEEEVIACGISVPVFENQEQERKHKAEQAHQLSELIQFKNRMAVGDSKS
ncbi:WD40-repeat-containing domain protein [Gorgonomyces haynaldii]|nr:WD40-repeat-containing domain protein [Gorgonomyces haynaldii]